MDDDFTDEWKMDDAPPPLDMEAPRDMEPPSGATPSAGAAPPAQSPAVPPAPSSAPGAHDALLAPAAPRPPETRCPICGGQFLPPAPGAGDAQLCADCGNAFFLCPVCGQAHGKSAIADKAAPTCDACGHRFRLPPAPRPAPAPGLPPRGPKPPRKRRRHHRDMTGRPAVPCRVCHGFYAPPQPSTGDLRFCPDCGDMVYCCPRCRRLYDLRDVRPDVAGQRCANCGYVFVFPDVPAPEPRPRQTSAPRPAPAPCPAPAPKPSPSAKGSPDSWKELWAHLFDCRSRCRARSYFFGFCYLLVLGLSFWVYLLAPIAIFIGVCVRGGSGAPTYSRPTPVYDLEQTIAGVCALALVFYPLVALITRRLHDLGLSGWWQLALWGALLALCLTKSLWAFFIFELPLLALFMLPGQRQSNRYGPPPD